MKRKLLIACVAIAGLLGVSTAVSLLSLDANQFRPQLEQRLGEVLGRKVTVGNIKVALLSGGIAVDDLSVADDPAFSAAPFVTARSVTVRVSLMPLIFSRRLRVQAFRLQNPQVVLLRSASGKWNFSGLGGTSPTAVSTVSTEPMIVSVHKIIISGGRILVGSTGGRKDRVYDNVSLQVSNLSRISH